VVVEREDDQGLVERARAGDRGAFARLAERLWGRVVRWMTTLSGCPHHAEDLAQEAFLKAWAALPTFQPGTNFRAWLFRIARNGFLDSRRGPRGRPTAPLSDALTTTQQGPVGTLLTQECAAQVAAAIARLPEAFRSVLLLRTQEGLAFADVARVLDVSEETARWRLFKARQMLLRELADYLDRTEP
jgi:RNA polymerase sigma-70 factor (ECF subfamily)